LELCVTVDIVNIWGQSAVLVSVVGRCVVGRCVVGCEQCEG